MGSTTTAPGRLRRPMLYAAFGVACAGLDLLLFTLLVGPGGWAPRPANILSVSCGITLSFLLNRRWSFGVQDRPLRRFAAFVGVGLLGMALADLVIHALSAWGGMWPPAAKLLSIPLVFVVQYNLNRLVSFRPAA